MRFAFIAFSLLGALPLAAQGRVPSARDSVRANLAIAQSDLRNLVTAQERFYSVHSRYTSTLDSAGFIPSQGSVITFTVTRPNAWAARLTRERLRGSCVIFVNLPQTDRPKTDGDGLTPDEGTPLCDPQAEMQQPSGSRLSQFTGERGERLDPRPPVAVLDPPPQPQRHIAQQ